MLLFIVLLENPPCFFFLYFFLILPEVGKEKIKELRSLAFGDNFLFFFLSTRSRLGVILHCGRGEAFLFMFFF